jgi:hypothetical protein
MHEDGIRKCERRPGSTAGRRRRLPRSAPSSMGHSAPVLSADPAMSHLLPFSTRQICGGIRVGGLASAGGSEHSQQMRGRPIKMTSRGRLAAKISEGRMLPAGLSRSNPAGRYKWESWHLPGARR